ncbi:MAG: DnaJ domain-containing protein [Candidatus Thermoplasmatota archaeon]|nr:DnaJ domain-containing protein [Candidatus Thermoplasmatota archaeon]
MEIDYYQLLGVAAHSTSKEIRLAYRRMAEVYHPDKLRHLPPSVRSEGEDIMRLLNEAKSVLLDPEKRRLYDQRMGRRGPTEDAIIIQEFEGGVSYEPESYIALENREVASMMKRVLYGLKEVFVRDKDFQNKIAIAQEIVEAEILDEHAFRIRTVEREDGFEVCIEDDDEKTAGPHSDDEGPEEIEMTLEFKKVTGEGSRKGSRPGPVKNKRCFRIVAMEGEDDKAEGSDDVEWED